jgi:hypothetical protein
MATETPTIPNSSHAVHAAFNALAATASASLLATASKVAAPLRTRRLDLAIAVATVADIALLLAAVAGPRTVVPLSILTVASPGVRFGDAPRRRTVQADAGPGGADDERCSVAGAHHFGGVDTAALTVAALLPVLFTRLHPLLVPGAAAALRAWGAVQ